MYLALFDDGESRGRSSFEICIQFGGKTDARWLCFYIFNLCFFFSIWLCLRSIIVKCCISKLKSVFIQCCVQIENVKNVCGMGRVSLPTFFR